MTINFSISKVSELESKLDYRFKNHELLQEALSHPSLKQHDPNTKNYEKLELLGDSILGFIVTEMIFNQSSKFSEGYIAKVKSYIVSKNIVSEIAASINLADYIIMTPGEEKSGGRENINNLENVMEALVAAIYLDSNIQSAKIVVEKFWSGYLNKINLIDIDPKSYLQELLHEKFGLTPKYEVIERKGNAHCPIFKVKVLAGSYSAVAFGKSIKEAEKKAAKILADQISSG